jgi:hypothetical protein
MHSFNSSNLSKVLISCCFPVAPFKKEEPLASFLNDFMVTEFFFVQVAADNFPTPVKTAMKQMQLQQLLPI